jgi:hypothetical protein
MSLLGGFDLSRLVFGLSKIFLVSSWLGLAWELHDPVTCWVAGASLGRGCSMSWLMPVLRPLVLIGVQAPIMIARPNGV